MDGAVGGSQGAVRRSTSSPIKTNPLVASTPSSGAIPKTLLSAPRELPINSPPLPHNPGSTCLSRNQSEDFLGFEEPLPNVVSNEWTTPPVAPSYQSRPWDAFDRLNDRSNQVAISRSNLLNPRVTTPRQPTVAAMPARPVNVPVANQFLPVDNRRRSPTRTALFKWRTVFSGAPGLDVQDFLFRIERLAHFERVSDEDLCAGFHTLVSGKAETWYWLYLHDNPHPTWDELRTALLREFQTLETDYEIRKLVEARKQGPRESFGDFRLAVHTLNCKMLHPIPERELLEILRRNMKPALQEVLLLYPIGNILDLRDMCSKFERLWSDIGAPREQVPRRMVHEIYSDNTAQEGGLEVQEAVEAFQPRPPQPPFPIRNSQLPPRPRNWICWNCSNAGHSYQDCSLPPQKLFCYGCGAEGVIKTRCKVCSPENRFRSQNFSGTPRILTPAQLSRRTTSEVATNTEPERNR